MTRSTASLGGVTAKHNIVSEYAGRRISLRAGNALNSARFGRAGAAGRGRSPLIVSPSQPISGDLAVHNSRGG
jgi:hypothetical protein